MHFCFPAIEMKNLFHNIDTRIGEPAPKYNYISSDEYQEREGAFFIKHQYCDRHILAMPGTRITHHEIDDTLLPALAVTWKCIFANIVFLITPIAA
jgi:hypothetical protein